MQLHAHPPLPELICQKPDNSACFTSMSVANLYISVYMIRNEMKNDKGIDKISKRSVKRLYGYENIKALKLNQTKMISFST